MNTILEIVAEEAIFLTLLEKVKTSDSESRQEVKHQQHLYSIQTVKCKIKVRSCGRGIKEGESVLKSKLTVSCQP